MTFEAKQLWCRYPSPSMR